MTDELDYEAALINQAADFSLESETSEEPLTKEELKKREKAKRLEKFAEKRKETVEKLAQTILDTQAWLDSCSQDRIQEILRQVSEGRKKGSIQDVGKARNKSHHLFFF